MTKTRIVLLIVFTALAVLFFSLERAGIALYVIQAKEEAPPYQPWAEKAVPTGPLALQTPTATQGEKALEAGGPSEKPPADPRAVSTLAGLLGWAFAIAAGYELVLLALAVMIARRRGAPAEIGMLAGLLRAVAVIAVLLALLHAMGKLTAWSATAAGFAGLLIGWSLQAPVGGLAAWALINFMRPFRVGDRVLLPAWGLIGDVEHVGMMYTILNQIGGTVGSEEPAGRRILVPNAMLFGTIVINYTAQQQTGSFVLDEVVIRITFDSNWDLAERILVGAAEEVTGDIVQQTGHRPYIRSDMWDYGILMRLRYMTMATDRPRIAHEINKRIFREFQSHSDVDFAIPYVYSYRVGLQAGTRRDSDREPPMAEVDVDRIHDLAGVVSLPGAEQHVKELASKIAEVGLLQPIVVERRADGDYNVLAGQLRLQACKSLGWKSIPVIVKRIQFEE